MRNIVHNHGNNSSSYTADSGSIWDSLVAEWDSLCSNPEILH